MATLRPRVAQAREGKAQARRSQGLFASASRRSSKTSLESGGGQTTSSRATPVTLTPVRTPAASPRRNWTSSPQRVRVTSRAHPAFCPLGQAGPGPGRGHSTCCAFHPLDSFTFLTGSLCLSVSLVAFFSPLPLWQPPLCSL